MLSAWQQSDIAHVTFHVVSKCLASYFVSFCYSVTRCFISCACYMVHSHCRSTCIPPYYTSRLILQMEGPRLGQSERTYLGSSVS